MAKQGQHKNDAMDQTKSPGPNKPGKTTPEAGQAKKSGTAEARAQEGKIAANRARGTRSE